MTITLSPAPHGHTVRRHKPQLPAPPALGDRRDEWARGPQAEDCTTTLALDAADLLALTGAACRDADPMLFFSDDMSVVADAKLVCADCPVRRECLAQALERREPHGVWGGELFEQGSIIERKRPRGRPRKHPLPLAA